MKKYRLLILLFICISINKAEAQKFNVTWGDNARLKFDYEDAVPVSNGGLIVLKFKTEGGKIMGFGSNPKLRPILVLVDKNMETVIEQDLPIEESNSSYIKFEKIGENIFFFYESYSKQDKTTSVYAKKVDDKTLASSNPILLGAYSSDSRGDQASPAHKIAIDSSKVLLFVEGPERKKENKKFFLGVFDTNLKSLWKKEVELPILEKFVSIYDYDLTSDGKVVVAIKHYDQEVSRQSVREDGIKVPSYSYKLLIFDDGQKSPKEMVFNLDNNYIQGTKLTYNTTGKLTVAGLYKKKYNGRVTGAFYARLNLDNYAIENPVITTFPEDLIEMVDKDGFGSDKQKDPGLSNNFRINHIMNRSNGSVDLIAEYYRLDISTYYNSQTGTSRTTYNYTLGDIVNTNIDVDGNAIFTRVPKRQKQTNSTLFVSYFPLVIGDKLVLLYNDDRDNIERDLSKKPDDVVNFKRSVFMATTINAKGIISRQSIYDHRDETYITVPTYLTWISKDTYMISSYLLNTFKKRTRFGVMTVK